MMMDCFGHSFLQLCCNAQQPNRYDFKLFESGATHETNFNRYIPSGYQYLPRGCNILTSQQWECCIYSKFAHLHAFYALGLYIVFRPTNLHFDIHWMSCFMIQFYKKALWVMHSFGKACSIQTMLASMPSVESRTMAQPSIRKRENQISLGSTNFLLQGILQTATYRVLHNHWCCSAKNHYI